MGVCLWVGLPLLSHYTAVLGYPENQGEMEGIIRDALENFKKSTKVDFAQMDFAWVERLQSIVSTAKLGAILLAVVLGLAVFFIAGNTIRLEIHNRREEVIIAKLVGATNGFIQRPFLYTGFG